MLNKLIKNKRTACYVLSLILLNLIFSCGEVNRHPSGVDSATITGVVQLGPVAGAEVTIYELFDDGTLGIGLGSVRTNERGGYEVKIQNPNQAPYFKMTASGGKFINEADGASVDNNQSFSSFIPAEQRILEGPITVLTDLVTERSLKNRPAANSMAQVRRNAAAEVSDFLGIKPTDIFTNPVPPESVTSAGQGAARHAMALTALSDLLHSEGLDSGSTPTAYKNLAQHFSGSGNAQLGQSPETIAERINESYRAQLGDSEDSNRYLSAANAAPAEQVTAVSSCAENSTITSGATCCDPGGCNCSRNEDEMYQETTVGQGEVCGGNIDPAPDPADDSDPPPTTCSMGKSGHGFSCNAGEKPQEFCQGTVSWIWGCTGNVTKVCIPRSGCDAPPGYVKM